MQTYQKRENYIRRLHFNIVVVYLQKVKPICYKLKLQTVETTLREETCKLRQAYNYLL